MSPELLEGIESNIGAFEKQVARAEQLSRVAREAAGVSTRASQEAVARAEKISKESREAAEAAAKSAREG